MSLRFDLEQFEGPLDLMLHLIKTHKLDLFDLDLVELCDQYVHYIHQVSQHHLSVASEYLSEMAGLLEYKSKKLLPRQEEVEVEDENKLSLVDRLLEYQRYKEVSVSLSQRYQERLAQFNLVKPSLQYQTMPTYQDYHHTVYDLIKAMSKVISRNDLKRVRSTTLVKKEYSIDDRIDELRDYLKKQKELFRLSDVMKKEDPLEYQLVTFLAILDMIRMNELVYSLNQNHEIQLKGV